MGEILSLKDVATILKVSPRTVQREVEAGRLEAFKVGHSLRFRSEAVDAYVEKQKITHGEKSEDDNAA